MRVRLLHLSVVALSAAVLVSAFPKLSHQSSAHPAHTRDRECDTAALQTPYGGGGGGGAIVQDRESQTESVAPHAAETELADTSASKPEFDTIPRCQVYNSRYDCAVCYPRYYVTADGSECREGQILGCLEYLSETTCARCEPGYSLDSQKHSQCRISEYRKREIIYGDGDGDGDTNESGIDWANSDLPPDSNEIPIAYLGDGSYFDGEDGEDGEIGRARLLERELDDDDDDNNNGDGEDENAIQQDEQQDDGEASPAGEEAGRKAFVELNEDEKAMQLAAFISMFGGQY